MWVSWYIASSRYNASCIIISLQSYNTTAKNWWYISSSLIILLDWLLTPDTIVSLLFMKLTSDSTSLKGSSWWSWIRSWTQIKGFWYTLISGYNILWTCIIFIPLIESLNIVHWAPEIMVLMGFVEDVLRWAPHLWNSVLIPGRVHNPLV